MLSLTSLSVNQHKIKFKKNSIFANSRFSCLVLFLLILSSFVSAQSSGAASQRLTKTLCTLYKDLNSIIPTVAFVLFVLAGTAYAGGQFFGAEMRAKATSWAMSMVTGAVIGLLIVQFASLIISNLVQQDLSTFCPLV